METQTDVFIECAPKMCSSMASPRLRAPRRCQKCHGAPLQSQCVHTKAGRIYQAALAQTSAHRPSTLSQQTPLLDGTGPEKNNLPTAQNENASTAIAEPSTSTPTLTTTSLHQIILLHDALTQKQQLLGAPDARPMASSPSNAASAAGSANVEEPSPPIPENDQSSDNGLWEYEAGAAGSTNVDERPSSPVADVDQSSDNLTHENYDLPPSSPQTPTRVRVTAQNPAFGVVEGAMRGSQKLGKYVFTISHILLTLIWTTEIRRPNMLRPRMMDRATATKRFHRELNNIIARCERLSQETNCWLVLAAQHSSSGTAATHYTSPNLRRDAMEDTLGIINKFQSVTSSLLQAKRQDALEIARQLAEADKRVRSLQEQVATQEAALAAANSLLLADAHRRLVD
ncbi:hypothetical protein AX14_001274 [Amanita brunnescens Koide BX004]|nr:hypothetical protein AX14_001274 [Amanita brunnescens Koide BX004]